MENSTKNKLDVSNPNVITNIRKLMALLVCPILKSGNKETIYGAYSILRSLPAFGFHQGYGEIYIPFEFNGLYFSMILQPATIYFGKTPKQIYLENPMSIPTVESKIPPEKMEKIVQEIAHMRVALDERIPEFSIQLQSILGQLQATPEATWALTDEQRKTIVDAFKQNVNITCFQSEKGGSVKGHKIPAGPLTPDMF